MVEFIKQHAIPAGAGIIGGGTLSLAAAVLIFATKQDTAELKVHVAEKYATKTEVNQVINRVDRKLERIEDILLDLRRRVVHGQE